MREALHAKLAGMPDVVPVPAWGETAYFVNPGGRLPRGAYFATIKDADGENDRASELDRTGVWRFNLGLPRPRYEARFGPPPGRPAKGGIVEGPWDFTAIDRIMPHPVYAWMSWTAVLCPSQATLASLGGDITAAHDKADAAVRRRLERETA